MTGTHVTPFHVVWRNVKPNSWRIYVNVENPICQVMCKKGGKFKIKFPSPQTFEYLYTKSMIILLLQHREIVLNSSDSFSNCILFCSSFHSIVFISGAMNICTFGNYLDCVVPKICKYHRPTIINNVIYDNTF